MKNKSGGQGADGRGEALRGQVLDTRGRMIKKPPLHFRARSRLSQPFPDAWSARSASG